MLKVAYLTHYDARDVNRWSGTGYHIGQALRAQNLEVDYLGPLPIRGKYRAYAKHFLYPRLFKQRFMGEVNQAIVAGYAAAADAHLARHPADVVVAPHTYPIAHLRTKIPIVLWADCTFGGMVDFYPDYTGLCAESRRDGEAVERAALNNARVTVFTTEWAARTARELYGVPADKIRIIPYGANIQCDRTTSTVESLVAARPADCCRLLFIGRIWKRKGGEVALEVARLLNEAGLPTRLTLVGSQPDPGAALPDYVRPLGFVNKAKPEGRRQLDGLFAESHFLVVPSQAEAYGIVFCEASSFGVPSLASNVGGIPGVVTNGANGQTFPVDAPSKAYADWILERMRNYTQYQELARSSFREYERRLNWSTAGRAMAELLG